MQVELSVDAINIPSSFSGFLTVSKPNVENHYLYWDRKWCVLKGNQLFIYNYPQEEENGNSPQTVFDLKNSMENFSGRQCRSKEENVQQNCLSLKYGLTKILLKADNKADFENWMEKVNFVMQSLEKWKMFV